MAAVEGRAPSAAAGRGAAAVALVGPVHLPDVLSRHNVQRHHVGRTLYVMCAAVAAVELAPPRKNARRSLTDLPDDVLRLIGSFVMWTAPDYASRARVVCTALKNGVDDTAKTIMLPSRHIPFVIASSEWWRKAMFTMHGMCCMCQHSPHRMTFCQSGRAGCEKAICSPCHDRTEQLRACTSCPQCAEWYCTAHFRRKRRICMHCGARCCRNCNSTDDIGLCRACVDFGDEYTYASSTSYDNSDNDE